jgi:hypothetical protein
MGLARGIGGTRLVRLLLSPGPVGDEGDARGFGRAAGERGSSGLNGTGGAAPGMGIDGAVRLFSEGVSLAGGSFRDNLLAPRDISSSDSSPGLGDLIARFGGGGGAGRAKRR